MQLKEDSSNFTYAPLMKEEIFLRNTIEATGNGIVPGTELEKKHIEINFFSSDSIHIPSAIQPRESASKGSLKMNFKESGGYSPPRHCGKADCHVCGDADSGSDEFKRKNTNRKRTKEKPAAAGI